MTVSRSPRIVAAGIALALAIGVPGGVAASSPDPVAPPASVEAWQEMRDHMLTMHGPGLGSHVGECVAIHGSMAGLLGPNGAMVEEMGGMMGAAEVGS